MAIFPSLDLEATVQVGDKTRLDASKSFVSKDEAAITLVEIDPDNSGTFIDVTNASSKNWFLDWQYSTEALTSCSIRVTTGGLPVSLIRSINVVSSTTDKLFSSDQDLRLHEDDILKYVPDGRNSFLNIHRRAQELIISDLDERGITDTSGNKLTKSAVVDISEVKEWSTSLVLKLIFQDLSNAIDDIFSQKSSFYDSEMSKHKNRSILRLDITGDGSISTGEFIGISTGDLTRS